FFIFTLPAPTYIYTLSLHDALPIFLPLNMMMLQALNGWLCVRYGDGLKLVPDLDCVPALEPRRETKRKGAVDLFKAQLVTRDEADRKSTRLNSSHDQISYAVFCLKK